MSWFALGPCHCYHIPSDASRKLDFWVNWVSVFILCFRDVEDGEHGREEEPEDRVGEVAAWAASVKPSGGD